jgi:hypothetical protein
MRSDEIVMKEGEHEEGVHAAKSWTIRRSKRSF